VRTRCAWLALLHVACGHARTRDDVKPSVAWPADAAVVRVQLLANGIVDKTTPPAPVEFLDDRPIAELDWHAGQPRAITTAGDVPLPAALLHVIPGHWLDPTFVSGERESCFVGGYTEDHGRHLEVDGGFCFHGETGQWRAVRLDRVPAGLGGGPGIRRECRAIRHAADGQRALLCRIRTAGQASSVPGSETVHLFPEEQHQETIRLTGIL